MAGHHRESERGPLRILIVEDECLIADYFAILIEDAGHEIAGVAETAAAALAQLAAGTVADVAMLDVRLPGGMDGTELAGILRSRYNLPFLFVTGSGEPEVRKRCEQQRPLAILQKPIKPEQLINLLSGLPPNPTWHAGSTPPPLAPLLRN